MKKSDIQIKRGDTPIDGYEPDAIPAALENGDLLPSDLFFDRKTELWKPLSEWKQLPGSRRKFLPAARSDSPSSSIEPPRPLTPATTVFPPSSRDDLGKRGNLRPTGQVRISDEPAEEIVADTPFITSPQPEEHLISEPEPSEPSRPSFEEEPQPPASPLTKRQLNHLHQIMMGWAVAAFCLLVALGFWAYSRQIAADLQKSREDAQLLRDSISMLNNKIDSLNLIAPSGLVRCMVTYEPTADQVIGMINVTVLLFRRETVEKALRSQDLLDVSVAGTAFPESIRKLKSALPAPVSVSLTNSAGRAELSVPEPGDYVLVCMPARKINGYSSLFLWLVGFQATSRPTLGILLGTKNAINPESPMFQIHDVAALAPSVVK